MSSSTTIVLVGCGSAKRSEPSPARELYTSTYFSLKRQYAEAFSDRWFVLSAEHGLVTPGEELAPYDTTMSDVDGDDWARVVWHDLDAVMTPCWVDVELVLLAGRDYTEPLRRHASGDRALRCPFDETGGIGEQMGWLSDELDAATGSASLLAWSR